MTKDENERLRHENLALKLELQRLRDGGPPSTLSAEDREEPILKDNPGRYVIFPIQSHNTWTFYKQARALDREEIDLANISTTGRSSTKTSSHQERPRLFAASDGVVTRTSSSDSRGGFCRGQVLLRSK